MVFPSLVSEIHFQQHRDQSFLQPPGRSQHCKLTPLCFLWFEGVTGDWATASLHPHHAREGVGQGWVKTSQIFLAFWMGLFLGWAFAWMLQLCDFQKPYKVILLLSSCFKKCSYGRMRIWIFLVYHLTLSFYLLHIGRIISLVQNFRLVIFSF